MPISQQLQDGLLTVVMTGTVSLDEFQRYQTQLVEERAVKSDVTFVDLSEVEEIQLGFAELQSHAHWLTEVSPGRIKEVIFAPSDLSYGVARMYQALVNESFQVIVCRQLEDAQDQLKGFLG